MKKILILTVCLIAGIATSFGGGTRTVTYSVSSDGKLTVSGVEPSGSTVEFTFSNKSTEVEGFKLGSGCNAILSLRGYHGYIVKSLTLKMHSNAPTTKNKGAGTFSFKHGDNVVAAITKAKEFKDWYNMTAYTNQYTNVRVLFNDAYADGFTVAENSDLTITMAATVNALYIQSYTITYQIPEGIVEAPIITPTKGEVFYRKQQIEITSNEDVDAIYYTTDGTEPTTDSKVYNVENPLYIDNTTTIKAIAVKGDLQSKARERCFEKVDSKLRAVVAMYGGCYYYVKKDAKSGGYLLGGTVNIINNMFLCSPKNMTAYVWQFYDNGAIRAYGSTNDYLNTDGGSVAKLGVNDKTLWEENEKGLHLIGSNRYLRYIDGGYFASYTESALSSKSAPAYPVNFVKGYARAKLTSGNWGTICLPYEVLSDDISGAVFYNIVGKNIEGDKVVSLMLEEETGTLVAGRPYLFQATSDALCCMYLDNAEESNAAAAGENNGLIGCLSQTDVAQGLFILNGNKVIKCGSGCKVNAYRAYIDMNEVPEIVVQPQSSRRVIEMGVGSGDGTTGIESVEQDRRDGIYYNLQGQKVVAPTRGLYIVNGKKVIKK